MERLSQSLGYGTSRVAVDNGLLTHVQVLHQLFRKQGRLFTEDVDLEDQLCIIMVDYQQRLVSRATSAGETQLASPCVVDAYVIDHHAKIQAGYYGVSLVPTPAGLR